MHAPMTERPFPQPDRISSSRTKIGAFLLIISSVIAGILLVEVFFHLFLPPSRAAQTVYKQLQRIVFFDGRGTIFANSEDIFTYVPANEVRNVTGYFSDSKPDGEFAVEYDYRFRTNNLGLVQDADIVPERRSLLLLGDSFTEGQGAEPWFRLVSPTIESLGYQPINGGLLGTGFQQWLKLEQHLSAKHIDIKKLVIPFVSLDYNRPVWNFKQSELRCLETLLGCRPDASYFYRFPPSSELSSWVTDVKASRAAVMNKVWFKSRAEALLPATYRVYDYVSKRLKNPASLEREAVAEQQSHTAIAELVKKYGAANVVFVHLPQKDERAGPISLGLQARRSIQEAGGRLVDGFKLCQLTPADYHPNDEHPNREGYAKIRRCVTEVITELGQAR